MVALAVLAIYKGRIKEALEYNASILTYQYVRLVYALLVASSPTLCKMLIY